MEQNQRLWVFPRYLRTQGRMGMGWMHLDMASTKQLSALGLAVPLHLVAAAAQEGADLARPSLKPRSVLARVSGQTSASPDSLTRHRNTSDHSLSDKGGFCSLYTESRRPFTDTYRKLKFYFSKEDLKKTLTCCCLSDRIFHNLGKSCTHVFSASVVEMWQSWMKVLSRASIYREKDW